MGFTRLLLLAAAAQNALAIGFSTYTIIFEGANNTATTDYSPLF